MTPALAQANSQANSQWNANIAPEPQIVIVGGGIAGAAPGLSSNNKRQTPTLPGCFWKVWRARTGTTP